MCCAMNSLGIILIFLYAFNNISGQVKKAYFEYASPGDCSQTDIFDAQTFICKKCPNNLTPSNDKLRCICGRNSKPRHTENNETTCELCTEQTVLTSGGNDCIRCQKNGVCQCLDNEIKVERNLNGTLLDNLYCYQCPKNSFASIDDSKCLPCSSITVDDYETFSTILHQRIQKYCLPENISTSWVNITSEYFIHYHEQVVDSYYLRTELLFTIYSCKEGNTVACQHLEHMCILTLRVDSFPCKILNQNGSLNKIFYTMNDTQMLLERQNIQPTYTLLANKNNSKIHFVAAKYSLRGKFQSINDWDPPCSVFKNIRFGVNISKSCMISAKDLLNSKIEFSTLYLSYNNSDRKTRLLYELPILIKTTYVDMGNGRGWQLMRKFFTVDSITGFKALINPSNSNYTRSPQLNILRFIKSLTIQVKLQRQQETGKIFTPLIIVEYGELTEKQIFLNTEILVEYKVIFSLTERKISSAIEIAIGCAFCFGVFYAAFKAWCYSKRNASNIVSVPTFSWFIVYCFGSIGNALLLVSTSASIYTFLFYKGQTVLHTLLPDDHIETVIKVSTMIAFSGKIVEIMSLIYHQRGINIFFIDWEQPRKHCTPGNYDSPHTSLRKSYRQRFHQEQAQSSQTTLEITGNRHKKTSLKSSQVSTPSHQSVNRDCDQPQESTYTNMNFPIDEHDDDVSLNWSISIWRTYFIANEWLRMKIKRKTDILFQTLITLFILEIIGLESWALGVPEWTLEQQESLLVNENFTLKYAVGAGTYVVVYSLQWIWSTLYGKYVKNTLQEFVDLCSVANISIFILSHDYYGHYIHGRSIHGFADKDLLSLINDLKREENHLCAHRGLIPGTTEQMFVMSVSKSFRLVYDALLGTQNMNLKKFSRRNLSEVATWDDRWRTHLKLRKFLCCFLDHCFKNINYTVKEKRFLEKLCDIEFKDIPDTSIFYIDRNYSFDETIFHGCEWALATFELITFLFILVLGSSYILSAILTICLSKVVILIIQFDQNKHLAKKTLIDRRFLM